MSDEMDEAFYRSLVESALDVITLISLDGRVLYNSPSLQDAVGHDPADLEGGNVLEYIHDEDQNAIVDAIARTFESEHGIGEADFRFRHRDGGYRRMHAVARRWEHAGEPALLVNSRDVTEQHAAQTALAQSNELLSRIFSVSSNLLSVSIPEDGTFLDVNDAWLTALGWQRDEVIGRSAVELNIWGSPENRDRVIGDLARAGELKGYRAHAYARDGRELTIIVDAQYLEVAEETRILLCCQDITELLRIEEELRQVQKLESLGQLTGGVAHDFNNILAVVMGNIELLREGIAKDSPLHEHTRQISQATQLGASLTRQLLAFSRTQPLSPTTLDLEQQLGSMRELLHTTASENTHVSLHCPPQSWRCLVDAAQLENAILNLTINARDAMPNGGDLTFRVSNETLTLEDHLALLDGNAPGEYVHLQVQDTGRGMSEAVRNRAFEPFFTTKEAGKGTGLGLSMVFGFVKQSGGLLAIDSAEQRGTAVSLYFPRVVDPLPDAEDPEHQEDPAAESPRRTDAGRALIIEDNDPVREVIRHYLQHLGYQVYTVSGGEELDAVRGELPALDLIVSDVLLQGARRGPELVDAIREDHPDCQVLFMTGFAESEVLAPGDTCLHKPFDRQQFVDAIAQLRTR